MKKPEEIYKNRMQNENPLLVFELMSDIHQLSPYKDKTLRNAFNDIMDRKQRYLFLLGDLSNNGYGFQFRSFFSLLEPFGFHHLIALGNHDTFHPNHDEALHIHPLLRRYVYRDHVYYKETIAHCSFYVLNTQKPQENNMYMEKDQLTWLKEELHKDTNTWKFVLCHHPLADTHPGSEERKHHIGYQNGTLESILMNHHVIFLSGHLHNSYSHTAMCQKHDILCINVPSFHSIQRGIRKDQIGLEISVYSDFLYGRFRDYKEHRYLDSVEYIYEWKKQHLIVLHPC